MYLAIVFGFSIIYWGTWHVKPDSFILNSELNIYPFQDISEYLWSDSPEYIPLSTTSLRSLKQEFDEVIIQLKSAEIKLIEVKEKVLEIENNELMLSEKHKTEIDVNILQYENREMEPFLRKEAGLIAQVSRAEKRVPDVISETTGSGLAITHGTI